MIGQIRANILALVTLFVIAAIFSINAQNSSFVSSNSTTITNLLQSIKFEQVQDHWLTRGTLNSSAEIVIGALLAILVASAIWIIQLRRLVKQRIAQPQRELPERELIERQRALEAERSRIARDLHDDLGSSLTEISVLASRGQRSEALEEKASNLFKEIASKARELVAALDLIVWAVDPKDNSLQSVADYLCDFVDEYLSPSGIMSRFDVPVILPSVVLHGRLRHDLFLAVKESLNNIVRHSDATEVQFHLSVVADQLEIVIHDNGKGFGTDLGRAGKGLNNLRSRLSKIGGDCEIESTAGQGTIVKINLCLSTQTKIEKETDLT